MTLILALVIGVLYAAGLYMMMRRHVVKLVIGLALLSQAANLLIFTAAGLRSGASPLIPPGADAPVDPIADPLPQALILTAIVISFAVMAFTLALIHSAYRNIGSDDIDDFRSTDT